MASKRHGGGSGALAGKHLISAGKWRSAIYHIFRRTGGKHYRRRSKKLNNNDAWRHERNCRVTWRLSIEGRKASNGKMTRRISCISNDGDLRSNVAAQSIDIIEYFLWRQRRASKRKIAYLAACNAAQRAGKQRRDMAYKWQQAVKQRNNQVASASGAALISLTSTHRVI